MIDRTVSLPEEVEEAPPPQPVTVSLTELLTMSFICESAKLAGRDDHLQAWNQLDRDDQNVALGAMHEVVRQLDVFGIDVTMDPEGGLTCQKPRSWDPPKPKGRDEHPDQLDLPFPKRGEGEQQQPRRRQLSEAEEIDDLDKKFEPHEPAAVASPPFDKRTEALQKGYSGDPCAYCGSMSTRHNGTCLVCEGCGETSGCS